MTNKEIKADANALMNLEMMDTITGGAQMCSAGCLITCTESCLFSGKVKNTEPPTNTPTPKSTPTLEK